MKYGGLSEDTKVDGSGFIDTLPPGIYDNTTLEKCELKNAEKSDGSEGKRIIELTFKTPSGSHTHAEWQIDEDDQKAESKSQNQFKRICHILRLFLKEEDLKRFMKTEFSDFDELGNAVVKSVQSKLGSKSPKMRLKIVGSVTNGQRRSVIPGYIRPPFIAKNQDPKIAFTQFELDNNEEYENFAPQGNTAEGYSGGVDSGAAGAFPGEGDQSGAPQSSGSSNDDTDDLPF